MESLSNIQSERNVLRYILQNSEFHKAVFTMGIVQLEHFTDLFHRDSFKIIRAYYNKFNKQPTEKHFLTLLKKNITYADNFSNRDYQRKVWLKSAEKIFIEKDIEDVRSDVDELETLRKGRLLQNMLLKSKDLYDDGEYEKAFDNINKVLNKSRMVDSIVTKGNIVDDLDQHIKDQEDILAGINAPMKTHLFGMYDTHDGNPKIIELDNYIAGGHYKGEVIMYVGKLNVGKSFILMEDAINSAKKNKKNTILFTIEMQKKKQERRIYSRITGIPYEKFKQGEITNKQWKNLRKKLKIWKKKYGILEVVAFDKGATVVDIRNEIDEAEKKYGVKFEKIVIDYLNDMRPIGRFTTSKSWDAQGEISWDLAQLSKYWNNHSGLAVSTANQLKTSAFNKEISEEGSTAFSALPEHHATVAISMNQSPEDKLYKRIKCIIYKNREGDKGQVFYMYPDFSVSKIQSVERIKEYYGEKDEQEDEED